MSLCRFCGHLLLVHDDQVPFKYIAKMEASGTSEKTVIAVDDLSTEAKSTVATNTPNITITNTTSNAEAKTPTVKQEDITMEDAANLKPAAVTQVSPENPKKRDAGKLTGSDRIDLNQNENKDAESGVETVTKTIVTKTVKDQDDNTTNTVTTTQSKFFAPPPVTICAKIVRSKKQKTKEEINAEINRALRVCDYTHRIITDNPLHQAVNLQIKESDMRFLHFS